MLLQHVVARCQSTANELRELLVQGEESAFFTAHNTHRFSPPFSLKNPHNPRHQLNILFTSTQKYMKPLKSIESNKTLIDSGLVDEIFYTIPEILKHHENFLCALQERLSSHWSHVVGHVFIEAVSCCSEFSS